MFSDFSHPSLGASHWVTSSISLISLPWGQMCSQSAASLLGHQDHCRGSILQMVKINFSLNISKPSRNPFLFPFSFFFYFLTLAWSRLAHIQTPEGKNIEKILPGCLSERRDAIKAEFSGGFAEICFHQNSLDMRDPQRVKKVVQTFKTKKGGQNSCWGNGPTLRKTMKREGKRSFSFFL